jgi:hypothetical protein
MKESIIIRRRVLTPLAVEEIKELIKLEGIKGRSHISKRLCEIWDWRQSNGTYKEIACREILRKLSEKGYIEIPERLRKSGIKPGYKNRINKPEGIDTREIECKIKEIGEIKIDLVETSEQREYYKGIVGTYHYLGYRPSIGENVRYLIYVEGRILSCIGFSASAWRVSCRDKYLEIEEKTREEKLRKIAGNDRFLILPWVKVTNLASTILSRVLRRIEKDWEKKYQNKIEIIETFVEKERFKGTCYKASNWRYLGETVGRGRNDRKNEKNQPIKEVYIYELKKDKRKRTNA